MKHLSSKQKTQTTKTNVDYALNSHGFGVFGHCEQLNDTLRL